MLGVLCETIKDFQIDFNGKRSVGDDVERLSSVLNSAPRLKWAMWSAMYPALNCPEGKKLVDLLPPDSIQKAIYKVQVEQAGKRPAAQP
jgi:hypothetical protein